MNSSKTPSKVTLTWIVAAGGVLALVLVLVSTRASSAPDGLEKSAEHLGMQAVDGPVLAWGDYAIGGEGPGATILAGVVGLIATLAVVFGLLALLRRSRRD